MTQEQLITKGERSNILIEYIHNSEFKTRELALIIRELYDRKQMKALINSLKYKRGRPLKASK